MICHQFVKQFLPFPLLIIQSSRGGYTTKPNPICFYHLFLKAQSSSACNKCAEVSSDSLISLVIKTKGGLLFREFFSYTPLFRRAPV